jgi:hypothetical protein
VNITLLPCFWEESPLLSHSILSSIGCPSAVALNMTVYSKETDVTHKVVSFCNDEKINGCFVRLQVLTVVGMKMTVFRDVAPCSLAEIDWLFRGAYCLHSDDGGSTHLWNTGQFLWDYTMQHPRRQSSSMGVLCFCSTPIHYWWHVLYSWGI